MFCEKRISAETKVHYESRVVEIETTSDASDQTTKERLVNTADEIITLQV